MKINLKKLLVLTLLAINLTASQTKAVTGQDIINLIKNSNTNHFPLVDRVKDQLTSLKKKESNIEYLEDLNSIQKALKVILSYYKRLFSNIDNQLANQTLQMAKETPNYSARDDYKQMMSTYTNFAHQQAVYFKTLQVVEREIFITQRIINRKQMAKYAGCAIGTAAITVGGVCLAAKYHPEWFKTIGLEAVHVCAKAAKCAKCAKPVVCPTCPTCPAPVVCPPQLVCPTPVVCPTCPTPLVCPTQTTCPTCPTAMQHLGQLLTAPFSATARQALAEKK